MFKKILRISGIIFLTLLVILFTAPFVFKGKIVRLVTAEINKKLNAVARFEEVDISFFRKFPKVSVQLDHFTISGIGSFKGDTLLKAEHMEAAVDFWSLVQGKNIRVHGITVESPVIRAIVNTKGEASWDIVRSDSTIVSTSESKPFNLQLKQYAITNGNIHYEDSISLMKADIRGLNHSGRGDFTADQFTLQTTTDADSVTFVYGIIPYLSDTKARVTADIVVNNLTNTYSFSKADILLNELAVATEGFVQLLTDSTYKMDIAFNAPSTDFKKILSLIPAVYAKDFNKIQTSGTAVFNGFVRGIYTPAILPAYQLNLQLTNGSFKYPDLPRPLEDIQLSVKVNNPDGQSDHAIIDITKGHFAIDKEPFDFRLLIKNPVTDLFLDGAAKGGLDLSKISQFVKLEAGTKLQGLLGADINVQGKLSAIEKKQYEQFHAAGFLGVKDFFYASRDYPGGIRLHTTALQFNPKNITVSECTGNYLNTNFQANGIINNLLSYVMRGSSLSGALNIKADKVNLNDWMGTPTDSSSSANASPFPVPPNLEMIVNAQVDDLLYDNLQMKSVTGQLQLHDETIQLDNVKANALDGQLTVTGSYSTKANKNKPAITLKYDVKELDAQKTFYAFNTVQKLMPVGKYIGGKLNSQLSLTGLLGDNMMPDLKTLTGNGNLFLVEGLLEKFKPLEKLAEALNVDRLKQVSLREVRQIFEFTDGKVFVKPFTVKLKDIDMEIGGMHGFDQTLDYIINLKLPRSLMGSKGNDLVNSLFQKAASRGVPLKLSEIVNLNVRMTGTLNDPSIKVELKEMAGNLADDIKNQAKEIVKAKIDSTKQAVKDTLQSVKKQVVKDAEDRLKKEIFGKKDTTTVRDSTASTPKKKVESATRDIIDGLFKKKKKSTDTLKTGG
ncbi:MAG TPA: AsmA-like C-terminal region-containing protein [Flavitalea sp.]|nr:AsmA-like C-terminal region-containing protein [Flavitalea sp.]